MRFKNVSLSLRLRTLNWISLCFVIFFDLNMWPSGNDLVNVTEILPLVALMKVAEKVCVSCFVLLYSHASWAFCGLRCGPC